MTDSSGPAPSEIHSGQAGEQPESKAAASEPRRHGAAYRQSTAPLGVLLGLSVVAPFLSRFPGHNYLSLDLQSFICAVVAVALSVALVSRSRSGLGVVGLRLEPWRDGVLLVFGTFLVLSWALATGPTASLQAVLRWLPPVLVFFLVTVVVRSGEAWRRVLRWISGGGALVAVLFVVHRTWPAALALPPGIVAPFAQPPNVMAVALILPLFASLAWVCGPGRRSATSASLALATIASALLLTRSRGAWLGVCVGAAVFVVPLGWRLVRTSRVFAKVASAGALLMLALFAATWVASEAGQATPLDTLLTLRHPDRGSAGGRLRRWQNSLPLILDHPWFGVGVGNWTEVYPLYRGTVVADASGDPLPYNSYVGLAAEAGLPACLALLVFFGLVLWRRNTAATSTWEGWIAACLRAALAALLVTAVFHDLLVPSLLLTVLFFTAGLVAATGRHRVLPMPEGAAVGASFALVVVMIGVLAAEYRHLRASLHHGLLVDRVVFDGPGRRLDLAGVPRAVRPFVRWYFAALEGPDPTLWELWQSQRTIRAVSPALMVARGEVQAGECDDARFWIERALASSALPLAWQLAGDCARRAGDDLEALAAYEGGIERNEVTPELHAGRGDALLGAGRTSQALSAYARASDLYEQRLAGRFGSASLPQAREDAGELRRIAATMGRARRALGGKRSSEEMWEAIGRTPLFHKGLTRRGDRLVYASNAAGHFDLWDVPIDGAVDASTGPRLLTRDPQAEFRPRAHPDGQRLYFTADHDGDYGYRLYEHDFRSGLARRLTPLLAGREAEFELTGDGRAIVVRRETGDGDDLYVVDTGDLGYRRATFDGRPKRDLSSSARGASVVWVESDTRISRLDSETMEIAGLVEREAEVLRVPRLSPSGDRLAFVSEEDEGRRRLWWKELGTGREVEISRGGSAREWRWLEPIWVGEDTLVVRARRGDEYLLFRVSLRTGGFAPVGPRSGVVYAPLLVDGERPQLAYAYGGPTAPIRLEALDLTSDVRRTIVRVEDFTEEEIAVHEIVRVGPPGAEVSAYVYEPSMIPAGGAPLVLWLHGASAEFSPRWHVYAQALTQAGFVFAAINAGADARGLRAASEVRATRALELVDSLRDRSEVDGDRVFAIGVSAGTRVAEAILERRPGLLAGVVSYSPVPSREWAEPRAGLPPHLVFLPENDGGIDLDKWTTELDVQRRSGTRVEWTILRREGHDLRSIASIRERLDVTRNFLREIGAEHADREVHQ